MNTQILKAICPLLAGIGIGYVLASFTCIALNFFSMKNQEEIANILGNVGTIIVLAVIVMRILW